MKVVFLVPSLSGGGAERSLAVLADALVGQGAAITVITYEGDGEDFYKVRPEVARVHLALPPIRWFRPWNIPWGLYQMRRALQKAEPDIVVSFVEGTNEILLLASLFWALPKVVVYQNDYFRHEASWHTRLLRRALYRRASKVVFLNEKLADWARRSMNWNAVGIPNLLMPIPTHLKHKLRPAHSSFRLIGLGRLVPQKNFSLLIESFGELADQFPQWSLTIYGEGPLRASLQKLIEGRKLQGRVFLPGLTADPLSELSKADVFAFSSLYEGQGMALMEAMACGIPAVSFACPFGPQQIVRHGVDGFLVPINDRKAFISALRKLMADEGLRLAMGKSAREVVSRFSSDSLVDQWLGLFRSLSNLACHADA